MPPFLVCIYQYVIDTRYSLINTFFIFGIFDLGITMSTLKEKRNIYIYFACNCVCLHVASNLCLYYRILIMLHYIQCIYMGLCLLIFQIMILLCVCVCVCFFTMLKVNVNLMSKRIIYI